METRDALRRHHHTPSSGFARLKSSRFRLALPAAAVAVIALGIGTLLLDWNPEGPSVVTGDDTAAAGSESGVAASADASVTASSASTPDGGAGDAAVLGGSSSANGSSDPLETSIRQGDELIAESRGLLASHPLSSGTSQGSQTQEQADEAFSNRVEALRDRIEALRAELEASQP